MKLILAYSFTFIFIASCQTDNSSAKSKFYESLKFDNADKIEIIIFPIRTSELTIEAGTITNKKDIEKIRDFVKSDKPIIETKKFASLPDGYFALYKDSTHIKNLYFSFESNHTFLQVLDSDISKQIEFNLDGDKYLREVYKRFVN
jgi:hypothetical protein